MKIELVYFSTQKENWSETATKLYLEKIAYFAKVSIVELKSEKKSRAQNFEKKNSESKTLLDYISVDDFVILFDENGKSLNSIEFSKQIERVLLTGKKRCLFIIGGAFGVSEEIKKRSNLTICLSSFVLNHHVAKVVALEQLYRAFTIAKGLPYHNS